MKKTKIQKIVENQKNKTIHESIIDLLNYLQEKDLDSELRQKSILLNEFFFIDRISKLCLQDEYIEEDNEKLSFYRFNNNKKTIGFLEDRFRITIKGLNFLGNVKKNERHLDNNNSIRFLTYGLFGAAFTQLLIYIIYNAFQLPTGSFLQKLFMMSSIIFIFILAFFMIKAKKLTS
jgi:hypothetical protein